MPDIHDQLQAVDDEALARRIADGPPGSTDAEEAELYRRFAPRVRLYGRRHLRDSAAGDDLAQQVLLLTIDRLRAGDIRRPQEIGSFILGTSRMLAQGERTRTVRRGALEARFLQRNAVVSPVTIEALDLPRVKACLGALGERDRLVVVLTFYADRDTSQIADELGMSAGAVRVTRHRAIARLRDCVLGGDRCRYVNA